MRLERISISPLICYMIKFEGLFERRWKRPLTHVCGKSHSFPVHPQKVLKEEGRREVLRSVQGITELSIRLFHTQGHSFSCGSVTVRLELVRPRLLGMVHNLVQFLKISGQFHCNVLSLSFKICTKFGYTCKL